MATRQNTDAIQPTDTGIIEVTELPAHRVRSYAAKTTDVHFERKNGRTFLVTHP
ncbi:MAG: hypothetical protein PPP58_09720 [Natronomonas sp.]